MQCEHTGSGGSSTQRQEYGRDRPLFHRTRPPPSPVLGTVPLSSALGTVSRQDCSLATTRAPASVPHQCQCLSFLSGSRHGNVSLLLIVCAKAPQRRHLHKPSNWATMFPRSSVLRSFSTCASVERDDAHHTLKTATLLIVGFIVQDVLACPPALRGISPDIPCAPRLHGG